MRTATMTAMSGLTAATLVGSFYTSLHEAAHASAGTTPTPASASTPDSQPGSGSAGGALKAGAYTGQVISTPYGPVQVKLTIADGKIADSNAIQSPDGDPRSQQINAGAVPQLNQQVTSVQSASLDGVSGATFTSNGYRQSLQSALDQASA